MFVVYFYSHNNQDKKTQPNETTKKNVEKNINNISSEDPGKITQFEISIPKLGITAPVIPNVDGSSKTAYSSALSGGVAHFKGTSLPNSGSNIFIFGHSSSILGTGTYDKIFTKLGDLTSGDEISISYNQKIYKYVFSGKKIITATDTSVLSPTLNEQLTLMTCWPIGTDQKRLIIVADPLK